jgi:hypothetical protein
MGENEEICPTLLVTVDTITDEHRLSQAASEIKFMLSQHEETNNSQVELIDFRPIHSLSSLQILCTDYQFLQNWE